MSKAAGLLGVEGQGLAEYSLAMSVVVILCFGLMGVLGGWAEGGEERARLSQTAPHSWDTDGGIPTWIVDTAVH